jgi:hypothetical protein
MSPLLTVLLHRKKQTIYRTDVMNFIPNNYMVLEFILVLTITFSLTQFLYFLFLSIRETND